MITGLVINHLWQSSCFVLLAAVLAFALRANSPKIRYWVWLSASLKFFVPFALLVDLGSALPRPVRQPVSGPAPHFLNTLVTFVEPSTPARAAKIAAHPLRWAPVLLGVFWAVGFLAITLARYRNWLRLRAALRAGTPVDLPIAVRTLSTASVHEPGVIGILRPVLLVPDGLLEQLSPKQLDTVLAHELCHVRRWDNLFAAAHMVVESIFWFNPLVWWVGSRLLEERELACDEEVLRTGCERTDYVGAILKVCRLYTESPLSCVSGVTGADVKRRLRSIITGSIAQELSNTRRAALAIIGSAAVLIPIAIGVLIAPVSRAQIARSNTQEVPSGARFDVISIKKNAGGAVNEVTPPLQHGRLRFTNVTVQGIMSLAFYPLDFDHIKGAPGWTAIGRTGSHYDIEAITEERGITQERYHQMLQTMLEDRFGLRFHWETHQEPVYLLVADKRGLKLKTTDPGSCVTVQPETTLTPNGTSCGQQYRFSGTSDGGLHLEGIGMTMKTLAVVLGLSGRPVIDRTGHEGMVDIKLDFTPANRLSVGAAGGPPSIFAALPEQLGLRLQPGTGPVDEVIIDHIERPSEN